jgi:hypothetical protein
VGLTETNFTADVLRMKSEGVQIVDLGATDAEIDEDFLQDAAQQNFHPDAIIAATAYDSSLFKNIGATTADDLYMPLNFPMYLGQDLGTNAQLALMTTWMHKVAPGRVPDLYAVDAWAAGVLFVQALKATGSDPTRTKLLAQIAKIHSFNADGLLPTADPGAKLPSTCMVIAGVQNGQFVRLDPPTKGFECSGSYYHLTAAQAAG